MLAHARRRAGRLGVLVALIALAGCGAAQEVPTALTKAEVEAQLERPVAGLPARARQLERAAGSVLPLPRGEEASDQLERIVRELRGTPIVVNLWGEWCGPCKKELPIFQRVALQQRAKVVFIGVATLSNRSATEDYLRKQIALPFPSLLDDPGTVNRGTGINTVPKTLFYDRAGKRTVHQGAYPSTAPLLDDIARYAS